jgi:hypothetical protein
MSTVPIEDESWSDLAAELGLDSGPQPKRPPPPPPSERISPPEPQLRRGDEVASGYGPEGGPASESDHDDGPDAVDAEPDDTIVIPSLLGEPVTEGDFGEPGAESPGQDVKKRRRRRRRRKKGAAGQPADADGLGESASVGEAEDEAADADDESDEPEPIERLVGSRLPAAAEDPPAEAARDVIANWNVPSWQEIVAGLYRPDR